MTQASASSSVIAAFCPTGKLRASINLGNPILANRDPATNAPVGISIDLARALGERLGVETEWLVFDKAVHSVTAVRNEQADIGFFAIDPARSEGLHFTAPYVLIEGSYLVAQESALQSNAAADQAGLRIGVASGSAYDLFLTREIKSASIERFLKAEDVVAALLGGQIDLAAGIRQMLEGAAGQSSGALRLLPDRFMVIQQAMGTPASRGEAAGSFLSSFVEEMKASGFVADSMKRHGIQGATVAPAGAQA